MRTCAIDIHHHYVPNSLLEEAKNHGKTLGVEFTETDGQKALSFAGSPKFVLQRELSVVDERLKMMQESKLALAALEAHTATLGYRLTPYRTPSAPPRFLSTLCVISSSVAATSAPMSTAIIITAPSSIPFGPKPRNWMH
jgi:hypothetical protein